MECLPLCDISTRELQTQLSEQLYFSPGDAPPCDQPLINIVHCILLT